MPDSASETDRRRRLPSVDRLLATEPLVAAGVQHGRTLAVDVARYTLADAREALRRAPPLSTAGLAEEAVRRLEVAVRGTLLPSSTPPA